ncbi:MAG: hypothetical protein AB9891_00170 [Anaerolineaceae bacterium]
MQRTGIIDNFKYSRFILSIIFWGISTFSIILCFLYVFMRFAYLPLSEKLILLLLPWTIGMLWCSVFLMRKKDLHSLFSHFFNKSSGLLFSAALMISITLAAVFIDSFPSMNKLSIQTVITDGDLAKQTRLEIINIFPVQQHAESRQESPLWASVTGSCQPLTPGYICASDSEGSIHVEAFSTSGIRIVIQGSPVGGKALLNWNGTPSEIETWRAAYDQFELLLPYKFDITRQTPNRKVELLVLYFSTAISIFLLLQLLVNLPRLLKKTNLISNSKSRFWVLSLSMLVLAVVNLAIFDLYQRIDIFRLQRVRGLSLIDLDNTSHDNIQNFQVVDHFYNYYRGFDLYAVPGALEKLRLSPVTFLTFARAGSVEEIDFSPELSSRQFNLLRDKELVIIEPAGKTPFEFVFIQVETPSSRVVCLWEYQGIYYFIPARDEINCLEGVK